MNRRFQFNLKWFLIVAPFVGFLTVPIYIFCDAAFHGPQVVHFNERCEAIVKSRGLIGPSPEAVRKALGEPTSWYEYGAPGHFTFNYAPHPSLPYAKFQAHFQDGKLKSTEMFDD